MPGRSRRLAQVYLAPGVAVETREADDETPGHDDTAETTYREREQE
jgi:hypothetical protein